MDKMKIKDAITGLVVGDALGVPVEFKRRYELLENPVTGMTGHGTYNMPTGTWSDDSSLALATIQSIINRKGIDYEDMLNEFRLFLREDKYTQYYTFDWGNTTSSAVERFEKGTPALECGGTSLGETTNGSLMRILPVAFIKDIDYKTVEKVSGITHAHELCKISCVLYIEIAKSMLEDNLEISEHIKRGCDKIREYYADSDNLGSFQRILDNELDDVESSFYVVETLECALNCLLTTSNYTEAVLKAVNYGNDTDTVAAICGGLAGIYYGFDDIPDEWIEAIPKMDYVMELCREFEELDI